MATMTPTKTNRKKELAANPPIAALATPASAKPTKQSQLINLLKCDAGASIAELVTEFGWQAHTTRAALTGLRKKGHVIAKTKVGDETRYSLDTEVVS